MLDYLLAFIQVARATFTAILTPERQMPKCAIRACDSQEDLLFPIVLMRVKDRLDGSSDVLVFGTANAPLCPACRARRAVFNATVRHAIDSLSPRHRARFFFLSAMISFREHPAEHGDSIPLGEQIE